MMERFVTRRHSTFFRRRTSSPRFHRLILESLENRYCLSVFYDFDIIAQTGQNGITSILPSASINDSGEVAFVANTSAGQSVWEGDGGAIQRISTAPQSTITYGSEIQINNSNQIAAISIISVGAQRRARIWDGNNPGTSVIIASSSTPRLDTSHFDALGANASMTNDGQLSFAGLESPLPPAPSFWEVHLSNSFVDRRDVLSPFSEVAQIPIPPGAFFRMMAADGDRELVANRQGTTTDITWYDITGIDTSETIASTAAGWSQLGIRPGISDDGSIVVFCGDKGDGLGIYARVKEGSGFGPPIRIAGATSGPGGINPDLGYDTNNMPIYFTSVGFELDSRVGVISYQDPTGDMDDIEAGESFVVSFIGAPSQSSRPSASTLGSAPILFSANKGLWTINITANEPLTGGGDARGLGALNFNDRTSAVPVIQVQDVIDGQIVTGIAVNDPIAKASVTGPTGTVLSRSGDHQLAFWVSTASGSMIVDAKQLDSDGDGLFNHWEKSGIDVDQDGTPELDLPAMGAQVFHSDLFVEMDWLRPDPVAGRNFSPQPAALDFLVTQFAAAPINNPSGGPGITVHIDAGSNLYRNMASGGGAPVAANLQGGDQIAEAGTNNHIHVVYLGVDGSVTFPSANDAFGRPIVTRSLESIKHAYFGTTTQRARELAFRYVVLADRIEDLTGDTLGIAESPFFSAAASSLPNLLQDYRSIPGNDVLLGLQGSAGTASGMLNVPTPVPGAPTTVAEPLGYLQGQTIMHEIGHTLGLNHGGFDDVTGFPPACPKPTYRSLMSYCYTGEPDSSGNLVRDFSRAGDSVFDDWQIVNLGFARYFDVVGNSFSNGSRFGLSDIAPFETPEITLGAIEAAHGPLESEPPVAHIAIASGTDVPIGGNLMVDVMASDNQSISSVVIEFDVNGDSIVDPGESIEATMTAPSVYSATFSGVAGALGLRSVLATARDNLQLPGTDSITVSVIQANPNQPPLAANDSASTSRNAAVAISVLSNDTDSDGTLDPTSVAIVSGAASGGTSIDPVTGKITYTPNAGFAGVDSFTYTVKDNGGALSNAATVTVTIVNHSPTAVGDAASAAQGMGLTIAGATLLSNDSDPDGDPLSLTGVSPTSAHGGTVSFNPVTFAVVYTSLAGFAGTDTFTYSVSDGLASDTGTVTVTVIPPPEIIDVRARFGTQSISLLGISRTLPWINITALDIVFSQDVVIDAADVQLSGAAGSLNYNPGTRTASLSLAAALPAGRFNLTIDGDGSSGDGNAGVARTDGVYLKSGDFAQELKVLPGDYNGDAVVTILDSTLVQAHRTGIGTYDIFADLDGDGDVDLDDVNAPRRRLGSRLL